MPLIKSARPELKAPGRASFCFCSSGRANQSARTRPPQNQLRPNAGVRPKSRATIPKNPPPPSGFYLCLFNSLFYVLSLTSSKTQYEANRCISATPSPPSIAAQEMDEPQSCGGKPRGIHLSGQRGAACGEASEHKAAPLKSTCARVARPLARAHSKRNHGFSDGAIRRVHSGGCRSGRKGTGYWPSHRPSECFRPTCRPMKIP